MKRLKSVVVAMFSLSLAWTTHADEALDNLARDLDRTESLRAVKTLQASYAQLALHGLWTQIGELFTTDGSFEFDGLVMPLESLQGQAAIADFLRTRYGGGHDGQTADGLSAMFIESPIVNLAEDGGSAKARWQILIFHGHDGQARIEGGVFENDYVRERGTWKFSRAHYYPQYDGAYEDGWTNWGGGDVPVAPRHYTPTTAGIPIPPPVVGKAPTTTASLSELQQRIDTLNESDRVRNLQSAYGFYADRKMWDDVVDLFADDGVVEVGGQGVWQGKDGVRRWLASIGAAGLSHGQLNDRGQNSVIVTIAPGGNEAFTRGIELGMLGEADQEQGWWEVSVFRNRFVKEDGVWKIRELRRFPLMKTDVFQGWGRNRITESAPTGANAPDAPLPAEDSIVPALAVPAFIGLHPVTGNVVNIAGGATLVASTNLTGAIPPGKAEAVSTAEAARRLARSAAYDGVENISTTYGYYIDDSDAMGWASTIAKNGYKETPFSGYHIGRDNIIAARVRGPGPEKQVGISYHWLTQPVVIVSDDARSATGRFRLFQPRTGKTVGEAGDFFAAQFWGGMYHNRYVLEDGVWRIWELTLDEPYITPVAWKDGVWAKAKDPTEPVRRRSMASDITPAQLGEREAHFAGGPGEVWEWPKILPMWFSYRNPVSGRVPELYQPECVGCDIRPELKLEANGYEEPAEFIEANVSPNR
ncbi:MAG: nuclear transport factor 2 family protein [Gammaproteobacteria bacterium]|nr:nuclear transport factor 2 family protein [Gammaproteobacteria bacterium]